MAVTKRTRYEVLRRDGHRCRYCGATVEDGVKLTVDHVIPVALGGADTPDNLVAACTDCNAGKSSTSPDSGAVAQVTDDALRWADAMERAAELSAARRHVREQDIKYLASRWDRWHYGEDDTAIPKDDGWELSLGKFLDAGLTLEDIDELIPIAMKSRATISEKWTYFCGCGWRTLDDRQAEARQLIERGEI